MNKHTRPDDVMRPEVTTGPLAASTKVYVSPQGHDDVQVPFREIALSEGGSFRVYDTYDDVVVEAPRCPAGGYTLFEYRKGPNLNEYLSDPSRPLSERFETWRQFLAEWGRRHRLAIEERETRLVHENGDADAFTDDNGHPFEAEINALAATGITIGLGDGRFNPQGVISRGEAAVFVARTLGLT